MGNKINSTNGGIGFAGLLTLLFIAFKLCKIINWSWVWVLCPLWINLLVICVVVVIYMIMNKR